MTHATTHDRPPSAARTVNTTLPRTLPPTARRRVAYLTALAWAFTFFAALRLLTYLPTIWSIHASGASDQHSLLTWVGWFGANLTMGLWLYEQADQRLERAALVSFGNATMCFLTGVVIAIYR